MSNKNIQIIDAETTDFSLVYNIYDLYAKINCLYKYYNNNDNTFEANEVVENIYIGSINSVYDIKSLKEIGITHIISVIAGFIPPYPEDFEYLVINAIDNLNTDFSKNFEVANEFISKEFEGGKKVLIHCQAGRSRSATILAAYIIKTFGMDVKNTLNLLTSKRDIIKPNDSFLIQLQNYYDYMYKKNYDSENEDNEEDKDENKEYMMVI
jgi:protein-tyrosine phosphatase